MTNLSKDAELGHEGQNLNSEFTDLSITQGSSFYKCICVHVCLYMCIFVVCVYL